MIKPNQFLLYWINQNYKGRLYFVSKKIFVNCVPSTSHLGFKNGVVSNSIWNKTKQNFSWQTTVITITSADWGHASGTTVVEKKEVLKFYLTLQSSVRSATPAIPELGDDKTPVLENCWPVTSTVFDLPKLIHRVNIVLWTFWKLCLGHFGSILLLLPNFSNFIPSNFEILQLRFETTFSFEAVIVYNISVAVQGVLLTHWVMSIFRI